MCVFSSVRMADVNIQTNKKTKRRYFELTSPEIASAGAQVLNCTFDSDRTEHELTGMTFFAYNKTAFSFTSIIPDNSEVSHVTCSSVHAVDFKVAVK